MKVHQKTPTCACYLEAKHQKNIWTLHADIHIIQNWFHILYHYDPLCISILQRFDSTHLSRMNKTISMFRDQRFDSMLKLFSNDSPLWFKYVQQNSKITHSVARGSDFFLCHILVQCSLARAANLALQSTWLECHLFHKGSSMLLALINALFLHGLHLLATPLGLHLSGYQVSCSNASTALLDRASSND